MFCSSSLIASNTIRANLTWLLTVVIHDMITLDLQVSVMWLFYNLQLDDITGTDLKNSLYAFGHNVYNLPDAGGVMENWLWGRPNFFKLAKALK